MRTNFHKLTSAAATLGLIAGLVACGDKKPPEAPDAEGMAAETPDAEGMADDAAGDAEGMADDAAGDAEGMADDAAGDAPADAPTDDEAAPE